MNGYAYVGTELELFAHARRWKNYFASVLRPFLQGDVLEVGAGIGGTTAVLLSAAPGEPSKTQSERTWTCLEPDPALAAQLFKKADELGAKVEIGTLSDLPGNRRFDLILYIDVLEHISDDRAEMERAAERLNPGGRLIVLSPAHQALYSRFDDAVGHCRRYSRKTLRQAMPKHLECKKLVYLDSAGMLLSLANRLLLRRSQPSQAQILFWDSWVIPLSRVLDRLTGQRLGKSVLGVWQKPQQASIKLPQRRPSLAQAA